MQSFEFTPEDPGTLLGGSRFKSLPGPVALPAGFQGCIVAEGFGTADRIGNQNIGALGLIADSGGCSIEFGGCRTGQAGFMPRTRDVSMYTAAYAAGTFEFGPAAPPPAQPQKSR